MHVIIDGYGGDPEQLSDENVIRVILDSYPEMMGMTKITQPTVLEYRGSKPEDWGVSGYVMIAESHIAMHTFPERRLVWADIFSCKDFDADRSGKQCCATRRLSSSDSPERWCPRGCGH